MYCNRCLTENHKPEADDDNKVIKDENHIEPRRMNGHAEPPTIAPSLPGMRNL